MLQLVMLILSPVAPFRFPLAMALRWHATVVVVVNGSRGLDQRHLLQSHSVQCQNRASDYIFLLPVPSTTRDGMN